MRALTTCLAWISTLAPVAGFRPMRRSRCCTTSFATPGSTNSPQRNNSCSVNCLTAGQDRLAPGAAGRDEPDADARQHPRRADYYATTTTEEDRC